MSYTLHQLRVFEAVARAGSITRAAEHMHMTQPAVSIQLKQLQEHFDIPLTEVVGRKLYLTQAGDELFAHIQRISSTIQEMEESLDELRGTIRGNLHFTVVSTGTYFMPYFLGAYAQQVPGINVQLQVTNRDQALRQLQDKITDFAVVSISPEDMEVESLPIMKNPLVLVTSPLTGQATGIDAGKWSESSTSIPFRALKDYPFILREQGSGTRLVLLDLFKKHKIDPKIPFELGTNEAIKQAIKAGLGISLISSFSLKSEIMNGELEVLPVKGFPMMTQWQMIWLKGRKPSPAARSFLEFMQAQKENITRQHFGWMADTLMKD